MKNLLTRGHDTRTPGPRKGLATELQVWVTAFLLVSGPALWAREDVPGPPTGEVGLRWTSLVPLPSEVVQEPGLWTAGKTLLVDWGPVVGAEIDGVSDRLDRVWHPLGRGWRSVRPGERPDLSFRIGSGRPSSYTLLVSSSGITVQAPDAAGRYYALVTLTQLLPPGARSVDEIQVACGRILDSPTFDWRGLMVDSSRHVQSVDTIEWILELMALHKLNRFHWHLTDDQGWRFPVANWPRLTEVGAWRMEGNSRYGGWYSADQIRRVVAFAAQRHIVVIPEVDLPGHSSAALAAYPELSATGLSRLVPVEWGVADGVLSLGRPSVTRFTSDVLATLMELFPGPWIHWGGDEVYRTPWMKNLESQLWMKSVRASSAEQALASFWTDLARKTLAAGKIPIGWDEVAQFPPPPQTVVQWWDTSPRALQAIRAGHPLIASWKESTYLDYPEVDSDGDRAGWMPTLTLESLVRHPFWPPGTPEAAKAQLLGLEATLWTERAPQERLGRKLFPRLALVADLAWTGQVGGAPLWPSRIEAHRERLAVWGVGMPPSLR